MYHRTLPIRPGISQELWWVCCHSHVSWIWVLFFWFRSTRASPRFHRLESLSASSFLHCSFRWSINFYHTPAIVFKFQSIALSAHFCAIAPITFRPIQSFPIFFVHSNFCWGCAFSSLQEHFGSRQLKSSQTTASLRYACVSHRCCSFLCANSLFSSSNLVSQPNSTSRLEYTSPKRPSHHQFLCAWIPLVSCVLRSTSHTVCGSWQLALISSCYRETERTSMIDLSHLLANFLPPLFSQFGDSITFIWNSNKRY